jgi:hypothetical protein
MANQQLIQGELFAATGGLKDGGFLDVGGIVGAELEKANKGIQAGRERARRLIKEQEVKAKAVDKQIAGYVNKMKSNVDLTGVSPEQQKAIQSYLVNQKNEYVKAANEIVNYSASDPEYMQYADIMNSVNNSFVNLSNTLKTYKANQAEFVDDFQNNRLSNGDLVRKKQAGEIYDPKTIFSIENGDFVFNTSDGNKVNFRDFKNPSEKAFKTATSIANIANTVYKAGAKLNPTQASSIRLQLEEAFNTNPDALRSIAADGFFNGQPMAINQEALNNVENTDELQAIVIDQLMEGISSSALQGYNDKQAKINRENRLNTSGYRSPEVMTLTSAQSPTGKAGKFFVYAPKDPTGEKVYVPVSATDNSNPTTTTTPTPTPTIDPDIYGEAEKFVKKTYPKLKEGSQEFADKVMEKYNSLK